MFDTELLKSFVAVAESAGFTCAAARPNSTQSTVSAQIQRLESDSIRESDAGRILLGYANFAFE
jgi:DNA-binding transcriptional LysR family regulator